jgi:hypothetical protein
VDDHRLLGLTGTAAGNLVTIGFDRQVASPRPRSALDPAA